MFSGLSPAQPAARRWTAVASFTLQAAIVAAALVFPMLYPQNLPQLFLARRIFVPPSNGEVRADERRGETGPSDPAQSPVLIVSRHGFTFKTHPVGSDAGPEAPALGPGPFIGIDLGPIVSANSTPLPPRPSPPRILRTSVVMEGNLIHRVEPQYPAIARQIRLQGSVILKAIISREGNIERIDVASGQTLLARAATDAVQQWKYRPYLLNGEPIEVETEITVNFILQH
jgi:protein TonB